MSSRDSTTQQQPLTLTKGMHALSLPRRKNITKGDMRTETSVDKASMASARLSGLNSSTGQSMFIPESVPVRQMNSVRQMTAPSAHVIEQSRTANISRKK